VTHSERLEQLLLDGEEALARGEHDLARAALDEMRLLSTPDDGRPHYLDAALRWDLEGPEAALPPLRRAVELAPDDGDFHHALAMLYEALDDHDATVRHFVQTRILDARADREAGIGSDADLDRIEAAAEAALHELPPELRGRLDGVPILLERRPSMAIVREGFDPRSFGLFEGPDDVARGHVEGHVTAPTRIVLYTSNLLSAFPEDGELLEQVRVTVLHEIAHYFGFEEEEMERIGLD
jgi:predicted Zn-dependent protease with MMP-like domain